MGSSGKLETEIEASMVRKYKPDWIFFFIAGSVYNRWRARRKN